MAPPPTFVFDVPVIDVVVDDTLKLLGELNDIVELFIFTILDLLVKFTVLPPDTLDVFILSLQKNSQKYLNSDYLLLFYIFSNFIPNSKLKLVHSINSSTVKSLILQ